MLAVTNYASVIRPLQIVVLAVAGLFLLRVMRVAIVEVRQPKVDREPDPIEAVAVAPQKIRRRSGLGLVFIEPKERAGRRIGIEQVTTVGRAADCTITVNDTYLSTRHAQFTLDDGDLLVEDLHSTNGTYVNQELIAHRTRLERGDIVQVGGVLFEVVR